MPIIQLQSAGLGMIPLLEDDPFQPLVPRRGPMQAAFAARVGDPLPVVGFELRPHPSANPDYAWERFAQWEGQPFTFKLLQELVAAIRGKVYPPLPAPAPAPFTSSMFALPSGANGTASIGAPSSSSMFAAQSGTGAQATRQSSANALSGVTEAMDTGKTWLAAISLGILATFAIGAYMTHKVTKRETR